MVTQSNIGAVQLLVRLVCTGLKRLHAALQVIPFVSIVQSFRHVLLQGLYAGDSVVGRTLTSKQLHKLIQVEIITLDFWRLL